MLSRPWGLSKREMPIGGRLLIVTHLDQSFRLSNQKQGPVVRSYLLHSSLASTLVRASANRKNKNTRPKPFCWAKLAYFDFSSFNLMCGGHYTHWAPLGMLVGKIFKISVYGWKAYLLNEIILNTMPNQGATIEPCKWGSWIFHFHVFSIPPCSSPMWEVLV